MELATKRLILRPFRNEDLSAYTAIRAKPEVVRWLPGGAAGAADARAIATRVIRQFSEPWQRGQYAPWAVVKKENQQLIGHLGLRQLPELDGATELLYMLDDSAWGKGYATEAARAAVQFGFAELGLPSIIALALPDNQPSIDVMLRIGMHADGEVSAFGLDLVRYRLAGPAGQT